MKRNVFRSLIALLILALALAACTQKEESSKKKAGRGAQQAQTAVADSVLAIQDGQQIPTFDYSQIFDVVKDVETIQAEGTHGTAEGYLEGVGRIWWCPTEGMPVPSTYQLSPTKQWVDLPGHDSSLFELDMAEPTGLYIGPSTNTNTVCLDDSGNKFVKGWEGYVAFTSGIVEGLPEEQRARVDEITYDFEAHKSTEAATVPEE